MDRSPKSYKQFCGVAKALDVVGERWTLLIVRDLLLGPLRYSDFQRTLFGITPNLLSKRLRDLVEAGVVRRAREDERRYELTPRGKQLESVVLGLGAFGANYMTSLGEGERLEPRAAALSLKRRYRGSAPNGKAVLRFGIDTFYVEFGASLEVTALLTDAASPPKADCELSGEFTAWYPLLSGRRSLSDLQSSGLIQRHGSARVAARLIRHLGLKP